MTESSIFWPEPIEKEKGITYETIKCLNENRIPYLIVTKSDLVADDKYLAILDKDLAHIQITVTTTNDELSKTYEKAVVPSRRIKANFVRQLLWKIGLLGTDIIGPNN